MQHTLLSPRTQLREVGSRVVSPYSIQHQAPQIETIPLSRTAAGMYPVRTTQLSGTAGVQAVQRMGTVNRESIYIHRDMDTPSGSSHSAYQGTGVPSVRIGHAIPNSFGLQQEMQQRREMEMLRRGREVEQARAEQEMQQRREMEMLRRELEQSRAEQARLAASLRQVEDASRRSAEELHMLNPSSWFKLQAEKKEENFQKDRLAEQERIRATVEQYHAQYMEERNRLAQALQRNNDLSKLFPQQ